MFLASTEITGATVQDDAKGADGDEAEDACLVHALECALEMELRHHDTAAQLFDRFGYTSWGLRLPGLSLGLAVDLLLKTFSPSELRRFFERLDVNSRTLPASSPSRIEAFLAAAHGATTTRRQVSSQSPSRLRAAPLDALVERAMAAGTGPRSVLRGALDRIALAFAIDDAHVAP